MSPRKSASGVPTRGVVVEEDDALVLVGDAQLEVRTCTIASFGMPRSSFGFSVATTFFAVACRPS